MRFDDCYHILWFWSHCRKSENPSIACAFESTPISYRSKKRSVPMISDAWAVWMTIDKVISELDRNELRAVVLQVTGQNGRLPRRLTLKLNRIFRRKGLLP